MTALTEHPHSPGATDYLIRYRRKIALNVAGWLEFVQHHRDDTAALDREMANLRKAIQQALAEPQAWEPGLALAGEAWHHVEQRGYWLAWQDLLEQAVQVSRQAGRPADEAFLLDQLGELARILGDNRRALEHFQAALNLSRTLDDSAGVGRVLTHCSQIYLALGDLAAAVSCCQEAVDTFEALDDTAHLAIAHNNWGIILVQQGRQSDALAHFDRAEAGFTAVNNQRGLAKAIGNRGDVFWQLARWPEATECYRRAIEIDELIGHEVHAARMRMNAAIVAHQQGRHVEALALHQEIEPLFRRLHDLPQLARVNNNMGIFLAHLSRFEESQSAFDNAIRLHLDAGDRLLATDALTNCAEHLLDQERSEEAADYLRRARALLDALPSPPDYLRRDWSQQWQRLTEMQADQPAGAPAG